MTDAIIFLCDLSGQAAEPWAEAGWDCYCVDIEHSIRRDRVVQHGAGRIHFVWGDVRTWHPPKGVRPVFGVAMTPCTHVAGSGARNFQKKGGYFLRDSLEYYESARHGFEWAGITYVMENSVGVLSSIPHGILFDPPFSPRQVKEAYQGFGPCDTTRRFYSSRKREAARVLKMGGIAIVCGWNSLGLGIKNGMELVEVLMVNHGDQNDTIVTVGRKVAPQLDI